jgi:small subunit ribosomal protein S19
MGKRSVWKGPFVHPSLLKKVNLMLKSDKKYVIKTWSRGSTIITKFVGLTFSIYNGKKFIPTLITDEMVGKKMGEFSPTRTFVGHKKNKK